jgi:hypothetical protein
MGMPLVTLVPPTFDDAQSVNLRVFIDDDGGGGCTIEFWVWDAIFKPGKFTRYASLPGKTTGSTIQNHTSILGFKYQQSYFVRAINGADVFDTDTMEYWPIRDNKLMDGQPWRVVTFAQVWVANTMNFVCTTDIRCHLFLAWSDHEPYIKRRAHQKRGTVMWHDGEHGLVVNGYVEQEQSGDTKDHTIKLVFPPAGGERWWFLFGEVDNRRSTSRTPFYYDKYIPPEITLQEFNVVTAEAGGQLTPIYENGYLWRPQHAYVATRFHFLAYVSAWYSPPAIGHAQIWSCTNLGLPIAPLTAPLDFPYPDGPHPSSWPVDLEIPPMAVAPGEYYFIAWGTDEDDPTPPNHYFGLRGGFPSACFPTESKNTSTRVYNTATHVWSGWGSGSGDAWHLQIWGYVP